MLADWRFCHHPLHVGHPHWDEVLLAITSCSVVYLDVCRLTHGRPAPLEGCRLVPLERDKPRTSLSSGLSGLPFWSFPLLNALALRATRNTITVCFSQIERGSRQEILVNWTSQGPLAPFQQYFHKQHWYRTNQFTTAVPVQPSRLANKPLRISRLDDSYPLVSGRRGSVPC